MSDSSPRVEYAVRCPSCREQAVALMTAVGTRGSYREAFTKFGARRIVCGRCGFNRDFRVGEEGEYELWYAADFEGNRVWANNLPHLDFLIAWLSGELGLRRLSLPDSAAVESLPKWLKTSKNRRALLEHLKRLRATTEPQGSQR